MGIEESVKIVNKTPSGDKLEAVYLPWKGMNFISFNRGGKEIIDQTTRPLFEERYAGLGALIGPHFHHRNASVIPPLKDESLFPHIALVKAKGVKEPFSHGIGRYAPWKVDRVGDNFIEATLKGSDEWKGVKLKELEGQDFTMHYLAEMTPKGLSIELGVSSDTGSVVGLHTYYRIGDGPAKVISKVQPIYNDQGVIKPMPVEWNDSTPTLTFDLENPADFGFYPKDPMHGEIELQTPHSLVQISYESDNQENSWQLWHPKGTSFACIEPLSAKDPRKPNLSVSRIKILIYIE